MAQDQRFLEVEPVPLPPDAVLVATPSKSLTHRAILMGLLTPHTIIDNPLIAEDTVASLRLAHALGARTSAEPVTPAAVRLLETLVPNGLSEIHALEATATAMPDAWRGVVLDEILARTAPETPRVLLAARIRLHVEGPRRVSVERDRVDLGNSGTTLRIGSALVALADRAITLDGDSSLRTRPMAPLLAALGALGAHAEAKDGKPPVTIRGPVKGGRAALDGRVSSQFVSAVLIAAQAMPDGLTLELPTTPASRPYIRLTQDMIQEFGGTIHESTADGATRFEVPASTGRDWPLRATTTRVAGDWSSAAFPLVAAAVTGGRVRIAGLDPESPQGDRQVLSVLEQAGCPIAWPPNGRDEPIVEASAPAGPLTAFTHSFTDTPDLFPALAVLAARAEGTSRLERVGHVRVKETDRVAVMARGLTALGFVVHEEPERVEITGNPALPIPAIPLETEADHRILMAFAVLGLTGPGPLRLTHPGCYHVSYPRFRLDLDDLGATSRVVTTGNGEEGKKETAVGNPAARLGTGTGPP